MEATNVMETMETMETRMKLVENVVGSYLLISLVETEL